MQDLKTYFFQEKKEGNLSRKVKTLIEEVKME